MDLEGGQGDLEEALGDLGGILEGSYLGRILAESWGILGGPWLGGILRGFGGILGRSWRDLGAFWGILGILACRWEVLRWILGGSLRDLGTFWVDLGVSWGYLWGILG